MQEVVGLAPQLLQQAEAAQAGQQRRRLRMRRQPGIGAGQAGAGMAGRQATEARHPVFVPVLGQRRGQRGDALGLAAEQGNALGIGAGHGGVFL
jgi:hypothetical protein